MASDWEIRWSNSRNRIYFYSAERQESKWDAPEGLSQDEIRSLKGAELLNKSASSGGAPSTVQASHLLIKHNESRRPSSWKEVSARPWRV